MVAGGSGVPLPCNAIGYEPTAVGGVCHGCVCPIGANPLPVAFACTDCVESGQPVIGREG